MKKFSLVIVLMFVTLISSCACEFKFNIEGTPKKSYAVGDEVIMKITLVLTHRNCDEGLDATKFDYKGFEVLGATQWKEIGNGSFERKFKMKVTANDADKSTFSAVRTCKKEGGSGTFQILVK